MGIDVLVAGIFCSLLVACGVCDWRRRAVPLWLLGALCCGAALNAIARDWQGSEEVLMTGVFGCISFASLAALTVKARMGWGDVIGVAAAIFGAGYIGIMGVAFGIMAAMPHTLLYPDEVSARGLPVLYWTGFVTAMLYAILSMGMERVIIP